MSAQFAPGDLVFARGREWVTMPSPEADWLCLRPLSGAEADIQYLRPELERRGIDAVAHRVPPTLGPDAMRVVGGHFIKHLERTPHQLVVRQPARFDR